MQISHYRASWINGSDSWPVPTWPMGESDLAHFRQEILTPWIELQKQGVGVHVGEWGCYNQTPHAVVLAWMSDMLATWKNANLGWSLWNLRGAFGVLDSERKDVAYENFRGHQLDRKMLELLRQ